MSSQDHGGGDHGDDEGTRPLDDRTRRMGGQPPSEPSRPVSEPGDERQPTRRYAYEQPSPPPPPPQPGGQQAPWSRASADDRRDAGTTGAGATSAQARRKRRGRDVVAGVIGVLLGFIVAVLVVALTTGDDAVQGDPADQSRIATLESRVSDLEAQLAQTEAELTETEAQLDQARAAAGEGDQQLQRQREALDRRAAALDEREAELDRRQQALAEREAALDAGEDDQPADGGGGDGGAAPQIDTEGVVEQVLQRLRELFGAQ